MEPGKFKIQDFSYDLPEERIAKYPLSERDLSKLLIYRGGEIEEDSYKNIADHIPENSLLVFNDTQVIHARLIFRNSMGAKIEVFCLEPAEENSEPISALSQKGNVSWKCLVGNSSKWKDNIIRFPSEELELFAERIPGAGKSPDIRFNWAPAELTFAEVIEKLGEMPIPPYLHRSSEEIDQDRYQTVYAKHQGSVAAPTAGLHFTPQIFEAFKSKNIKTDFVTLHVGAGTFRPVKSETLQDHDMHAEWIDVRKESIAGIIKQLEQGRLLIAVGTTSLRTMETLYWMGVKAGLNPRATIHELEIRQWDPYDLNAELAALVAMQFLEDWMEQNKIIRLVCKTQMLIVPSYKLRMIDALITNFHQPGSTLLLLVAAVVGDDWRKIYDHAMGNDFRFLSYGDGSLLFKN